MSNKGIKSKKSFIFIISLLALIVLSIATMIIIFVRSSSPERRLREQLDLGARYLEELNYEQAIAAYEAAIAIDAKNVEAYTGIIDAYRQIGDDESALEYAEKAYEETDVEVFKDIIDELSADAVEDISETIIVDTPVEDEPAEELEQNGLSGDPNEVVVEDFYVNSTMTIYGDGRLRVTLTDDSIHDTYTIGKGTVEDSQMEYGWIVVVSDGTTEIELAVQSWMWDGREIQEVTLTGDMQHSIWYDGMNMRDMDVTLEGHTIIWDFYMPEHGENGYYEDVMIPRFDLMNTRIKEYYIALDGEYYFY